MLIKVCIPQYFSIFCFNSLLYVSSKNIALLILILPSDNWKTVPVRSFNLYLNSSRTTLASSKDKEYVPSTPPRKKPTSISIPPLLFIVLYSFIKFSEVYSVFLIKSSKIPLLSFNIVALSYSSERYTSVIFFKSVCLLIDSTVFLKKNSEEIRLDFPEPFSP